MFTSADGLQKRHCLNTFTSFVTGGVKIFVSLRKMTFLSAGIQLDGSMFVSVKNHRGDVHHKDNKQGRMYDRPGDPKCPVASFKAYMSRLHPDNPNFWQRPKRKMANHDNQNVWYDNIPLGKNTLYSFMTKLSEEGNLSQGYTNHCIRATTITALDHSGVEAGHIMGVSGHKSEASIKAYSANISDSKKREMSDILSENEVPTKMVKAVHSTCNATSTHTSTMTSATGFNLPDFLDDDIDIDSFLSQITEYELLRDTNQAPVPVPVSIPGPIVKKTVLTPNFNFSNCQISFNFGQQ